MRHAAQLVTTQTHTPSGMPLPTFLYGEDFTTPRQACLMDIPDIISKTSRVPISAEQLQAETMSDAIL
jgi:hypothetical protein